MNKNTDDVILTIGDAKALYECQAQGVETQCLTDMRVRTLAARTSLADRILFEESDYATADMVGKRWKDKLADICRFMQMDVWERLSDHLLMDAVKGLVQLDKRWRDMPNMLIAENDEILYVGLVQLFAEHDAKSEVARHHKRLMNAMYDRMQVAA